MADNIQLNAGTGGAIIAADNISNIYHPYSKVEFGSDGTATSVDYSNPLPVSGVGLPSLGIAGTSSTDVISIQGIAGMTVVKVDGSAVTQPVSGPLTNTQLRASQIGVSGYIIENNSEAIKTSLQIIDDWDETDRAKVNLIVGQAGIAAGVGVVGVTVPRITLASDDPAVSKLTTIDVDTGNIAANVASVDGKITACNTNSVTIGTALPVGTNLLGKIGIDQTTPGATNKVFIGNDGVVAATQSGIWAVSLSAGNNNVGNVDLVTLPTANLGQQLSASSLSVTPATNIADATYLGDIKFGESLPAGTNLLGKVSVDQTTPGTTNKVSIGNDGQVASTQSGVWTVQSVQSGPWSVSLSGASLSLEGNITEINSADIKTSIQIMDDWDENDRVKINPIVGQVGISANSGLLTDSTVRVSVANNDLLNTTLAALNAKVVSCNTGSVTIAAADNNIGNVDIVSLPAGNLDQRGKSASLSIVPASDIPDATYLGDIKFGESLPAGTSLLGKVGIDQTTPGTTNKVSIGTDGQVSTTQSGNWQVGITGSVPVTGTFWQATQPISGTVTANQGGTWNVGTVTNVVHVDDNTGSLTVDNNGTFAVQSTQAGMWAVALTGTIPNITTTPATNISDATYIGDIKFGEALPAGTNLMGKVGIDQTTPGTTNKVNIGNDGQVAATQSGTWNIGTVTAVTSLSNAFPAGDNNIGNVDIASAIPAGTNLLGKISAGQDTTNLYNGATALTIYRTPISINTSGTNEIVAADGYAKIRTLSIMLYSAGSGVNAYFESATTAIFGSANAAVPLDKTGIAGPAGFCLPYNPLGWCETSINEAFNINLSVGEYVGGCLVYTKV
jgi:hypothetical protein